MTDDKTEETGKPSVTKKEPKQRPLGVTEKRDLAKVIDGQFSVLSNEMEVFANDLERRRIQEIEDEYAAQVAQGQEVSADWQEVRRQCRALVDEFRTRWRERGYTLSTSSPDMIRRGYGHDRQTMFSMAEDMYAIVPAKETALNNVKNDVRHQVQRARNELERQRITMQRELLLSGISEEASRLMAGMPDPREMLITAIQASGNPRLVAIEAAAVQQVNGAAQPVQEIREEGVRLAEVVE